MKVVHLILVGLFAISCSNQTVVETSQNFEQVELPDGSVVSLNKNSKIKYVPEFNERTIELVKGEAYFSVESSDRPFTVTAGNGEVVVLGTEFILKKEGADLDLEVDEGKVEMKIEGDRKQINKGQRGYYQKGKGLSTGKGQNKHKVWISDMQVEFNKIGRDFHRAAKHLHKDLKKMDKNLDINTRKLQKDLNKRSKRLGKGLKK